MTQVTKYDLAILTNNYFVWSATSPKNPVTPDVCARFAYQCYQMIVSIPSDATAKQRLYQYIISQADYYGIDIKKAAEYLRRVPGVLELYFQYIKDNFGIQSNEEIIKDLIKNTFSWIGEAAAGAVWGVLKPFLPIIGIGLLIIFASGKALQTHK